MLCHPRYFLNNLDTYIYHEFQIHTYNSFRYIHSKGLDSTLLCKYNFLEHACRYGNICVQISTLHIQMYITVNGNVLGRNIKFIKCIIWVSHTHTCITVAYMGSLVTSNSTYAILRNVTKVISKSFDLYELLCLKITSVWNIDYTSKSWLHWMKQRWGNI